MTTKTTSKASAKAPVKSAIKTVANAVSSAVPQPVTKGSSSTAEKKDVQKLQRAIVNGLEDVKAQDIVVFDTEHLSSLFERVIIASGTSNRQTKALAFSVMDAVREAGFLKPRMEGESNGEWIIVDCGQAVVHVMQPAYRLYYNLEELWGEKPVRLKLGVAKPDAKVLAQPLKAVSPKQIESLKRSSAAKKGVAEEFPSKAQVQAKKALAAKSALSKPDAKKTGFQGSTSAGAPTSAAKTAVVKAKIKTLVINAPVKPSGKKTAVKKLAVKKMPAKKATAR